MDFGEDRSEVRAPLEGQAARGGAPVHYYRLGWPEVLAGESTHRRPHGRLSRRAELFLSIVITWRIRPTLRSSPRIRDLRREKHICL
jgi:hypothetical protein